MRSNPLEARACPSKRPANRIPYYTRVADITRRAVLKGLVATGVGAFTGAGAYGYAYERHALRVVRLEVPVWELAPALDGLRLGLITDIHHSATVPQADVARAVDLVSAHRPDLVVLGGDYISNFEVQYAEPCADALEALEAEHGVFAVLGNHDDEREMPAALRRRRFTVLADTHTTLRIRGESLTLAGIRFWTRRTDEIGRALGRTPGTTILLAHDPRRLSQASELGVPLVLSGHTHGGQVVLPGVGAIAARKFPVVAGLEERNHTRIFVSRGVGTVYVPLRINCPPEVAILTLRRQA
jgi:uncharacterized protein